MKYKSYLLLLTGLGLWLAAQRAQLGDGNRFMFILPAQLVRLAEQVNTRLQASPHGNVYLPEVTNHYQAFPAMRLTFDTFSHTEPALSPDNKTVLYLSERLGQTDIYSMPLQGGTPVNLSNTPEAQEDTPVFSPDGAKIAFASNRQGDWDIYLLDRNSGQVQMAIGQPGTDELQPVFLPDGTQLLFSSNRAANQWDIYSATLGSTLWTRLTTTAEHERFPTISANGSTIAFRRELTQSDGSLNSEIYVMQADGAAIQRVTNDPAFDGYPVVAPDGSGLVFVSNRANGNNVYTMNLGGGGLSALSKPIDWSNETPRLAPDGRSLLFAVNANGLSALYVQPYESPLLQVGQRGFQALNGQCDWEAGVLAYGWIKVWRKTHRPEVWQWLKSWVDGCLAHNPPVQQVNDGLLGYAALAVYVEQPDANYLAFAERVADYLMHTAHRTADGTLTHLDDAVWDDTMVSITPFLVAMSQVSQNQSYFAEAVAQVRKHAAHLQDPQTGLYYHAWDESAQRYIGTVYWCRGNAWPLLADVEILAAMPIDHSERQAILHLLQRHAAALQSLQAASGLWHTVVNRTDFYEETSGSAMIAAAFLESSAAGWLSPTVLGESAQRAKFSVWRQVAADGRVTGVSGATGPMANEIDYNRIPISTLELYGQGAVLWMGAVNAR